MCIHSDEKKWACDWPDCGTRFKVKEKLKVHMLKHTGERPVKCEVQGCDRRFQFRQAMKFHMERHHHIQVFVKKNS